MQQSACVGLGSKQKKNEEIKEANKEKNKDKSPKVSNCTSEEKKVRCAGEQVS